MDQTQVGQKAPAPKWSGLVWDVLLCGLAVLVCGAALWSRFGGVANAASIVSTGLAVAVQALTLVLALTSKPRMQ